MHTAACPPYKARATTAAAAALRAASGARRYALVACATVALAAAANAALSLAQLGRHTDGSAAICAGIGERVGLARAIPGPKLVAIGGSGVRYGVNAGMLAERLGVNALNFGLQASLGPGFILAQAKRVLRPGDTALLLFEYDLYRYGRPTKIALDVIFGCGADYFHDAPAVDRMGMAYALPLARAPQVLLHRERPPELLATTRPAASGGGGPIGAGDIALIPANFPPLSEAERRRVALYKPMPIRVDPEAAGAEAIAAFTAWARANGIRVLAGWPNTIAFPAYAGAPGLAEIREFYARLGVPVVGTPDEAFLPLRLFYDTQYHLTPEGIRLRTARLAEALRPHLSSPAAPAVARLDDGAPTAAKRPPR